MITFNDAFQILGKTDHSPTITTDANRTGLDLAVCRQIIVAHNRSIQQKIKAVQCFLLPALYSKGEVISDEYSYC